MNCLVVSYGSIGKRHAAILHQLGCEVNLVTTQEIYEFVCYQNIKEALHKKDFDYVVIANPTHLHFSSIVELISCEFTGIVLVEKPIFANLAEKLRLPRMLFSKKRIWRWGSARFKS